MRKQKIYTMIGLLTLLLLGACSLHEEENFSMTLQLIV